MAFEDKTRRIVQSLGQQSLTPLTPNIWRLPKVGFASTLQLVIKGSVTGVVTAPSAYGFSAIVQQVKVTINGATEVVNITGPGYHYGLRNFIDNYFDPVPQSNARSVVTAAAYDIGMLIPLQINERDQAGLIALQNEQTEVVLQLTPEANNTAVGTGGAVYTGTVEPFLEFFTTPEDKADWPKYDVLHRIIEEVRPVPATGDYEHIIPRGNVYLQLLYILGAQAAGAADNWSAAKIRVAGSQYIEQITPDQANIEFGRNHPATRGLGLIPFDWLGSNGIGAFGGSRDAIHSDKLTDLKGIITASSTALPLRIIRRELVGLNF